MLLRLAEQVEAVNLNVATTLAGALDVTKVEVRTRRPCVDYAAVTIKVSRDKIKLNKKPFFAGHDKPDSLEQKNADLFKSYVSRATNLNKVGRGTWVPKCAVNLTCLQPPPPPPQAVRVAVVKRIRILRPNFIAYSPA